MSKKTRQTLITSRDSKGLHAVGLFEAVYNKSKLDEARAQRLNEHGGELQDGIAKLIAELSVSNQFADEEVESSYAYPKGYKVKGITEQTNILRQLFPGIGFADEKLAEQPLPPNAEGWFAIPKWEKCQERSKTRPTGRSKSRPLLMAERVDLSGSARGWSGGLRPGKPGRV